MASERDRCPAHVDGIPDRLYLRKEPDAYDWVHDQAPGIEPDETEYTRSDLAEQREAELVEAARALSTAVENIDGDLGGVDLVSVYAKADHLDAILAKFKPEGAEGA